DARAFGQRDDRLLEIGAAAGLAAHALCLALDADRVDGIDLDVEQTLDRSLDLALCRIERDAERHLVMLGGRGRLLGNDRRAHDVVHLLARQARLAWRDDPEAAHLSTFILDGPPTAARRRASTPKCRAAGCRRHWRPAPAAHQPSAGCGRRARNSR